MRDEIREVRRLKELLTRVRLTQSERSAIEQQIKELEKEGNPTNPPGVLGVFDRPVPTPTHAEASAPQPSAPTVEGNSATDNKEVAPESTDPDPELTPAEAEALADRLVAIAGRIVWLRSYWARTLSVEVAREAEAWLARLHEVGKGLPGEVAEAILGEHTYLLRQKVRDLRREQITQKVQLSTLPPSAPSLDAFGTWSELYFALREPVPPPPPRHPPGYVPDGLQQFL